MRRVLLLMALLGTMVVPAQVHAQWTFLTIDGFPVNITTTGADFVAGHHDAATPTSFVVDAWLGTTALREATVSLRCGSPCPSSGTKSISSIQWRRADLGTWNTLTTSNVVVEQRNMARGGVNDPWGNDIYWRFTLNWLADAPGVTGVYNIIFTLTLAAP